MGKLSELPWGGRMWPKNRDLRVKSPQPGMLPPKVAEAMRKLVEEHRSGGRSLRDRQ